MSESGGGDVARASVLVRVPEDVAFRVFTEEIDAWWRRGRAYRVSGAGAGFIHVEPFVGGRLFESFEDETGATRTEVTGRVRVWEPPRRLVLTWWATNFAPGEETEVEVTFEPRPSGTNVTVTHRGWLGIRGDHPVRHGQDVQAFLRMMGMWWGALLTSYRERAITR